jgi:hypothetical protein
MFIWLGSCNHRNLVCFLHLIFVNFLRRTIGDPTVIGVLDIIHRLLLFGLDNQGVGVRVPIRQEFPLLHVVQTGSGACLASHPVGTGGSFPGVKLPRREADHWSPTSAEIKNTWIYISTFPYVFIKHRDNFTCSLSLSLMLRPTVSRPVCLGTKHPTGAYDQIFITCVTVTVLFLWGALSDERSGLPFVYAAGPCKRSLSRVRVPWDLRPYFTVSLYLYFTLPAFIYLKQRFRHWQSLFYEMLF